MPRSTSLLVGAVACGICLFAGQVFVPSVGGTGAPSPPRALRGGDMGDAALANAAYRGTTSGVAMVGLAGALVLMASAQYRMAAPRTACRAEPITATAAAAVAAKAAGAAKAAAAVKGAAKTAGAVAGSASTGTMAQSISESDAPFDEVLRRKKFFPQDRGTPEYEKYMRQLRNEKEVAWKYTTGRNPDGNFGGGKDSEELYDPFMQTEQTWLDGAKESGIYAGEFQPSMQVGATEPLGFFDPLGFCKKGDKKGFAQLRAAEIKHGRVAMMASIGAVVQHYVQFPGFKDVPTGLGAVNTPPGSYGAIALFAVAGALELGIWRESPDKEPGNFGDPLGLDQYTEEFRNREINNGRFAMFAVAGIIAAELLTGKDAIEQIAALSIERR